MSTKLPTIVRSVLVASAVSLLSGPSFGATLNPSLLTTVIKPVLISDLLTETPSTTGEFSGKQLLDSLGRYEKKPMVYKTLEFNKDPIAKSVQLIKQLNVNFNTDRIVHLNDKWLGFQNDEDASSTFEFDTHSGNIHFNRGLKGYSEERSTPNLPDERQITQFAAKHLIDLGLLPPLTEINLQKIEIGGLNMAVPDSKGGSKVFEKLKTVRAFRVLDGVEVEGDSRLIMHLGENGELAGIVAQWPQVSEGKALTENDLIPAEKLREAALANIQRVLGKSVRPELTEAKLVLYDDGQGVIEPAYHFVVKRNFNLNENSRSTELTMIPYDFYLPIYNKSRAAFPDLQSVMVQPLDGRDEKVGDVAKDE